MTQTPDAGQVLVQCRVIWLALVMGTLFYAGIMLFLILRDAGEGPTPVAGNPWLLTAVAGALTVTMIPIGLFLRGQFFKKGWVADVVTPGAYMTGNIMVWAMCEGCAFLGIILCFLSRQLWPSALPPALAIGMLLLLYPNGKAMFPRKESA